MNKCKNAKAKAPVVASCYAKAPRYKIPERPCQCFDPGCPVHAGSSVCMNPGTQRLLRVDMADDIYGTLLCAACASDAMESGLFRTTKR